MNEKDLIEQHLVSLPDFHELLNSDHKWQHQWLVLGSIVLDPEGVWEVLPGSELPERLSPVVDCDTLRSVCDVSIRRAPLSELPKGGSACVWCQGSWNIRNMTQREVTREGLYHPRCWQLKVGVREAQAFASILERAGIQATLTPIPNEYDGSPYPWFEFSLPGGDVVIGWRKRVISIECPESVGIDGRFPEDEVTKGPGLIHAYGEDKAVEYLKAIAEALKVPT